MSLTDICPTWAGLLAVADGVFPWIELMLATLRRWLGRDAVEKMLEDLPVSLGEHILISIGLNLS